MCVHAGSREERGEGAGINACARSLAKMDTHCTRRVYMEIINNAFDGAQRKRWEGERGGADDVTQVTSHATLERAKRLQVVPFFNDDQIGRTCDIIILLGSNMRRRRPLPAHRARVSDLLLIIRLITP